MVFYGEPMSRLHGNTVTSKWPFFRLLVTIELLKGNSFLVDEISFIILRRKSKICSLYNVLVKSRLCSRPYDTVREELGYLDAGVL